MSQKIPGGVWKICQDRGKAVRRLTADLGKLEQTHYVCRDDFPHHLFPCLQELEVITTGSGTTLLHHFLPTTLRSIQLILQSPLLLKSDIQLATITSSPGWGFDKLHHLKTLSIMGSQEEGLTDVSWLLELLHSLPHLESLEELYMSECGVLEGLPSLLSKMTNLSNLILEPCNIISGTSPLAPETILDYISSETVSSLSYQTYISPAPFNVLSLARLEMLVFLDLDVQGTMTPYNILALTMLKNLTTVTMKFPNLLQVVGADLFHRLTKAWGQLRSLDMCCYTKKPKNTDTPPALHLKDLGSLGSHCPALTWLVLDVNTECTAALDTPTGRLSPHTWVYMAYTYLAEEASEFVSEYLKSLCPEQCMLRGGYPRKTWKEIEKFYYQDTLPDEEEALWEQSDAEQTH